MEIIPAIDILNGYVVHAKGGERAKYKRLKSWLTQFSDPFELIYNFKLLGFKKVYLADLDSILKCEMNIELYKRLNQIVPLMLDIGIRTLDQISVLFDVHIQNIIIATETLPSLKFASDILSIYSPEYFAVSIDLKAGKILSPVKELINLKPEEALKLFKSIGYLKALVIDLHNVGRFKLMDPLLIRKLVETGVDVIIGGGVKDISDILKLDYLGVKGVLVASSLHKKTLTVDELKEYGFL